MTMASEQFKKISDNRKAFFDYAIEERIEAGIVLTGTEIKSVRAGQVNLRDAYARLQGGEMWLYNMHIAQWSGGGPWNHDPLRPRKLLLHKEELARLGLKAGQQGLTIVPLRVYIKDHHAKVEVALAKGKRKYDKRQTIIRRETDREMQRAIRLRQ
jgi:SsrA-binding protein